MNDMSEKINHNAQPNPMSEQALPDSNASKASNCDLNLIMNVPVNISVEIGRAKLTIQKLTQLNQGSVIELDRLAGEPLDIRVNGTLIAHGEAVVINDKFGIRLTDVVNKDEALKNLGK